MPVRIPTGSPGNGFSWYEPDLAALFLGVVPEEGTGVSVVNAAWAFGGGGIKNRAECNITFAGAGADAPREGYIASIPIAPLLALLGVTVADLESGAREIVALVRLDLDPGDWGQGGVALCNDAAQAALDGGGGGARGSTSGANKVLPCAWDSTADAGFVGGAVEDYDKSAMFVALPLRLNYVTALVTQRLDPPLGQGISSSYLGHNLPITPWPPVAWHLALHAGGASGSTVPIDMRVWFGVRTGINTPDP